MILECILISASLCHTAKDKIILLLPRQETNFSLPYGIILPKRETNKQFVPARKHDYTNDGQVVLPQFIDIAIHGWHTNYGITIGGMFHVYQIPGH